MNEKFLNLLIKWNNGLKRGAQVKLAKNLAIKESIVSMWVSGAQIPGEANLHKMAALFGQPVSALYKVFNRKPRLIGEGLELVPKVEVSFSALAHAGEVIFIDEAAEARVGKGDNMKLYVKIADDGFSPALAKGDIVVIDTRADKQDGLCLARKKQSKQYMLCQTVGLGFYNGAKKEKKTDAVIIGWAVEVISIKKL